MLKNCSGSAHKKPYDYLWLDMCWAAAFCGLAWLIYIHTNNFNLPEEQAREFLLTSMNCAATLLALLIGATIGLSALTIISRVRLMLLCVAGAFLLLHIIGATLTYFVYDSNREGVQLGFVLCLLTFGLPLLVFEIICVRIIMEWEPHSLNQGKKTNDS